MGKLEFKEFVKNNPSLYQYVKNNEMTWQKFYEMFDLYGENHTVWNNYLKKEEVIEKSATAGATIGFTDFLNWFKNMNLDEIQDGLNSIGRVISVLQDLGTSSDTKPETTYKPRPVYKHFED